jgi:hypothetical protein
MASGQQIAEENVRLFQSWVASKTDDEFRDMVVRGCLSRSDIAKECGFAKSALAQNPRIKAALLELETILRERGVMPPVVVRTDGKEPVPASEGKASSVFGRADHERLRRLEQENALLRSENEELKAAFGRRTVLHEALTLTGRLPR